MLNNHCKTLKICLFGQTTKQPTSNFEPWKSGKYEQHGGLGSGTGCLWKSVLDHLSQNAAAVIKDRSFLRPWQSGRTKKNG